MNLAVNITSWVWLALEVSLRIRDRLCSRGSIAGDQGTRKLIIALIVPAVLLANVVVIVLGTGSPTRITMNGVPDAGLVIMWLGLALRVWAITSLGRSFRTTVEVDQGQQVVDRGPYRWIRHPSYSGVLLITIGYGLALGDWIAVTLTTVVPVIAMLRRIDVEEDVLVTQLGPAYEAYCARTRRLLPGLW